MGNTDDESTARDRARAAFIDTVITETVTLACTAVLFAAVYWRADLTRLAARLLRPPRPGPAAAGQALIMAQFRAELSEIDHAPQGP